MKGKIDWVAIHPTTARTSPARETDSAGNRFKRDVGILGPQAERNHVRLAGYAQRVNTLRTES